MINLYLLKYNNYYNRKIKREETIQEYENYILAAFHNIYTFDYADGINTSHVLPYKGETPDYAIVTEEDDYGNEAIKYRWYVVESSYIRGGKYRISLRRDLVADNLDEVLDSTCMVEKGYINDPFNDDGIFNDEGQSYNQIKVDETLLYDESKCPWIVGYLATPKANEESKNVVGSIINIEDATEITDFSQIKYYNYFKFGDDPLSGTCKCELYNEFATSTDTGYWNYGGSFLAIAARKYTHETYKEVNMSYFSASEYVGYDNNLIFAYGVGGKFNDLPSHWNLEKLSYYGPYYWINDEYVAEQVQNTLVTHIAIPTIKINDKVRRKISDCITQYGQQKTSEYNIAPSIKYLSDYFKDRYYSIGGRLYHIEITFDEKIYISSKVDTSYSNNIMGDLSDYFEYTSGSIANSSLSFTYIYDNANVLIKEITRNVSTDIPGSTRSKLTDAPYCMFCMPYGDIPVYKNSATAEYTTNKEYNLAIANNMTPVLSTEVVYDIQILPYCPVPDILQNGGVNLIGTIYSKIRLQGSEKEVGFILWCNTSSFTNDIQLKNPITIKNYKEESSLDLYRLCDPSHTQVFEFNAAKNDGIGSFHLTCTYKPYSPYINIHPYFKRLYGKNGPNGGGDYDDSRGLICGGDYSLPIVSNAWTEYEYRNKNYQNTFNREIQSMELSNKIQKRADIVNAVSTTINAGIQGSIGAGNILGSAAAIPAGIGGSMDIKYKEMLRNDQVDKAKTLFNYNLQNIQALANTVSKSNPYNIDNKYVPYLEKYTCSDVEREAFKLKMKYDGMTIMRTGTLRYFLNYKDEVEESYIKGAIIRFPNLSEDYNYAKELSNEVGQGFYLDRRWY